MWIPAGVSHRTTLNKVHSGAVFFRHELVPTMITDARVIPAAPIVQEMVFLPCGGLPVVTTKVANSFFRTLGLLCAEWLSEEMPFRLPAPQSEQIAAAMDYTLGNLETSTIEGTAKAAALSPRQLRRRFVEETGIGWRQFRLYARMLRAMEMLIEPHANVTTVAYSVGFNSLSAFAKAFARVAGEPPNAYRERSMGYLRAKP
jgi:AraC-like DNA-binding protein